MNAHVHQAADDVPRALGRLRVALEYAYVRASRELDLTAQQAELLCAAMKPVRIGDLATALRCDRSNVSRLVDRAASRGLLERQPAAEDGRVSVVRLSSDGEMLASRFIEALERQTAPLLAGWSAARQRNAIRVLNEVADSLECDEAEPRRRPAPRRSG
ncbi:MAG TPA: MarR family transcriptional regulator [Nocardioidaceae bacterium]|nr:MarR family transcriptional regulator [Nocardioidaceae bacterium]